MVIQCKVKLGQSILTGFFETDFMLIILIQIHNINLKNKII